MALPWFRLYTEFATDPKIQRMEHDMQRHFIMLLCLQGNETLQTLNEDDIAYALGLSDEKLLEVKHLFIKRGLITKDWIVVSWGKRQVATDSGAARQKTYRLKQAELKKAIRMAEGAVKNAKESMTKLSQ